MTGYSSKILLALSRLAWVGLLAAEVAARAAKVASSSDDRGMISPDDLGGPTELRSGPVRNVYCVFCIRVAAINDFKRFYGPKRGGLREAVNPIGNESNRISCVYTL